MSKYFFVSEEPLFEDIKVLKEESKSKGGNVIFEAVFQKFEEKNRNRRIYTREAGAHIFSQAKMLVEEKVCLGEMDHPVTDDIGRNTKVLLKNAAFMITDIYYDGQIIQGKAKTLSNDVGQNLKALILDGVKVGFSLRAFGKNVTQKEDTEIVHPPVLFITFDAVTRPSHPGALIQSITESQFTRALCNADECRLKVYKESMDVYKKLKLLEDQQINNSLIEEYILESIIDRVIDDF